MNLVADESIDAAITIRLRQEGHYVWAVAEIASGLTDEAVLALAHDQRAILVTADKILRRPSPSSLRIIYGSDTPHRKCG